MAEDNDLALLSTCDAGEAALLEGMLRGAGIEPVVQGSGAYPLGGAPEHRIYVQKSDLEKARALLEAKAEPEELPPDTSPQDGRARCPVHQRESTGPCVRCGTFLCEACGEGCPTCDENDRSPKPPLNSNSRKMVAWLMLAVFLGVPGLLAVLYRIFAGR